MKKILLTLSFIFLSIFVYSQNIGGSVSSFKVNSVKIDTIDYVSIKFPTIECDCPGITKGDTTTLLLNKTELSFFIKRLENAINIFSNPIDDNVWYKSMKYGIQTNHEKNVIGIYSIKTELKQSVNIYKMPCQIDTIQNDTLELETETAVLLNVDTLKVGAKIGNFNPYLYHVDKFDAGVYQLECEDEIYFQVDNNSVITNFTKKPSSLDYDIQEVPLIKGVIYDSTSNMNGLLTILKLWKTIKK